MHSHQVDLPEVLRVKGLIRLGEAKAACRWESTAWGAGGGGRRASKGMLA
jgi:hypothetical protein